MPSFELTAPWGQKYRVDAPEGATQEQAYDVLKQHLSQTQDNPIGQEAAIQRDRDQPGLTGMAARGLTGVAQGFGELAAEGGKMFGMKPGQVFSDEEKADIRPTEKIGRIIGRAGVPVPGGPLVQGAVGGVEGALQPADSWTGRAKNAAIGAGSASGLGALARQVSPREMAHIAGLLSGFTHGGFGGAYLGGTLGRTHLAGRLGQLVQSLATNYPGLAAQLGIGGEKAVEKTLDGQQRGQ
jgi:hypothetical protein